MQIKTWTCAFILIGTLGLGCGAKWQRSTKTHTFLYGTDSANISVFEMNRTTGKLTESVNSPIAISGAINVRRILVDPKGRFLFTYAVVSPRIGVYKIDSHTGEVSADPIATADVTATNNVRQPFAISPSGKSLFVNDTAVAQFHSFYVDETSGLLTETAGSPTRISSAAVALAVHPSGNWLVIKSGANLLTYSIEPSTGVTTYISTATHSGLTTDGYLVFSESGAFLYSWQFTGSVQAYAFDLKAGVLTEVSGSPYTATNTGSNFGWMHVFKSSGLLMLAGINQVDWITVFDGCNCGTLKERSDLSASFSSWTTHSQVANREGMAANFEDTFFAMNNNTNGSEAGIYVFSSDFSGGIPKAVTGSPFASRTISSVITFGRVLEKITQ